MSAWRIGAEDPSQPAAAVGVPRRRARPRPAQRRGTRSESRDSSPITAAIDRLTRWIPGDVLAIYVAGVTALTSPGGKPSVAFLVAMVVATFLVVVLGAFSTGEPIKARTWAAAALGGLAFAIWTLSVPMSGWNRLSIVADNKDAVAITAAVVGLLFGYFADGVMVRIGRRSG
jgi:hypothetical protein